MTQAFFFRTILQGMFPVCFMGLSITAWAQASDPAAILQRIANAARNLSYSGVFVHSTQDSSTATRITHVSDRGGEWEKIEPLDGPPSEIIRRNEEMYCYHPQSKTVRLERRLTGRFFPSLLTAAPQAILDNYQLKTGATERIGGYDCQWVFLEPRDTLRYLQALCADVSTGLLVRAATLNERNQVLEQFTFTQLNFGKDAVRDFGRVRNKLSFGAKPGERQTDSPVQRDMKNAETGWMVANPPAGFNKVMEMKRTMAGRTDQVSHLVFSDGVVSVSIFIAPLSGGIKGSSNAVEDGMVSYAMRPVDGHQATALGEVPLGAAQLLVNGVSLKSH